MANNRQIAQAKKYLVYVLMNQVGTTWEENERSAQAFIDSRSYMGTTELLGAIHREASRYEDM